MRIGTFSLYDMESWIELRSGLLTLAKTMSRFDFLDGTGKFGQTERRKGKKSGRNDTSQFHCFSFSYGQILNGIVLNMCGGVVRFRREPPRQHLSNTVAEVVVRFFAPIPQPGGRSRRNAKGTWCHVSPRKVGPAHTSRREDDQSKPTNPSPNEREHTPTPSHHQTPLLLLLLLLWHFFFIFC